MFRAISHQIENNENNYDKYRKIAVNYLKKLDTESKNYLEEKLDTDYFKNFDDYIKKMEKDREWGDDMVLQALSNELGRIIISRQLTTGYINVIHPRNFLTGEKLQIKGNTLYLGHIGETHYVSLKPKKVPKLQFFSGSKDMPAGKGAGEYNEHGVDFSDLNRIKDWRKTLSNFDVCRFEWSPFNNKEKYTFNSIEHAFQYRKIALVDKDAAFSFTVDSGSDLGLGDGLAARKARKLKILNGSQLNEWGSIKEKVMESAAKAKYTQCKIARNILKLTKNAELWHSMRMAKPVRFIHLEKIRSQLKEIE